MCVSPDVYAPGSNYHARRSRYAAAAVRCLGLAFDTLGEPKTLLDVGCGATAPLVQTCQVIGIDAWGVDAGIADPGPAQCMPWDLADPLDLAMRFEWVLCWEVAEHLPADAADTLCDSLVRHLQRPAGRLLFTAARPGQRGPGHINCQSQDYWRALFAARGLGYLQKESGALARRWRLVLGAPWYARNVQVFGWA